MLLPNRHGSTDSYRYGFQGQEKDDEIKGEGNSLNYTYRMHDPRLGRFFAVDPMVHAYPWYSPYQYSGNTPIMSVELEGLEPIVVGGYLVGYTVQAGQGPSQIAKDLNNPLTQFIYGYTLQEPVNWKGVAKQNKEYYKSVGDWGTTDMMDVNNKAWNNLNSEKGDELRFFGDMKVEFTTKPLTYNLDWNTSTAIDAGKEDVQEATTIKLFQSWGGGTEDIFGNVKRRSGYNYKIEDWNGFDFLPGSGGVAPKTGLGVLLKKLMWFTIRKETPNDDVVEKASVPTETAKENKVTYEIENFLRITKPYHSGNGYRIQTEKVDTTSSEKVKAEVISEKRAIIEKAIKRADSLNNNG